MTDTDDNDAFYRLTGHGPFTFHVSGGENGVWYVTRRDDLHEWVVMQTLTRREAQAAAGQFTAKLLCEVCGGIADLVPGRCIKHSYPRKVT